MMSLVSRQRGPEKMWYDGFRSCFTDRLFSDNKKWDRPSCQIVTVISLPNTSMTGLTDIVHHQKRLTRF